MNVLLPGRFVDWLDGTSAAQGGKDDPAVVRMIESVRAGVTRKRGRGYSVEVRADDECCDLLREYAGYLLDAVWGGDDDPAARAEAAAARKVLERL